MQPSIDYSLGMRLPSLAQALERAWYGDSRPNAALRLLARGFGFASGVRRGAYRRGLLRSETIGAPVIVVGNITVGGAGKTPIVEYLARQLTAAGRRPGIVSRGYGGSKGAGPHLVGDDDSAGDVGDEPLLLARRTGVPVCVGIDRVAAAKQVVIAGANCVIADDGLQHYRLARDLEIAVLDGQRMTGNDRLLPAGPLREPSSRLAAVDLLLVNGEFNPPLGFGFELVSGELKSLDGLHSHALSRFAGRNVWAIAGIGHPERFYAGLRQSGLLIETVPVGDHGYTSLDELRRREDKPIIMTEKDAVKYLPDTDMDAWYLPVKAVLSPAAEAALAVQLQRLWPGGVTLQR